MSSNGITFAPRFVKIGQLVETMDTHTHTHNVTSL